MTEHNLASTAPRALVLGAAGFIGRAVCREMAARGYAVDGLGHGRMDAAEQAGIGLSRWHEADITLDSILALCAGRAPAVVIHCCGSGAVAHSYAAPVSDFERSVGTTQAMLEYCRLQEHKPRAVLASSAAVYGDQGERDIAEDAALNPVSPYGYHKVMAEQLCAYYQRFFGVQTRVVRLFSVYGEGLRKQLLWDALTKLANGSFSFFGTGAEVRDWIHVDDAARLLAVAAVADGQAPLFLNGGNTKASTKDVLTALARAAGSPELPVFSGVEHPGNPRRLTADTSLAHSALAFSTEVSLEQGLARYARWFAGANTGRA